MKDDFAGKIAVVTGSTQGLGAAIATLFAERGAEGILTCGRNQEKGRRKAAAISRIRNCKAIYQPADLAQVADCRAVIEAAKTHFGRIDILVNAAAMTDRGTILDTSVERFDAIFAINVRAPFFLIQEAAKIMVAQNIPGRIVNIGSVSAHAGQPFIAAYCASKGALATLTGNTAHSLMRNHIRINQLNIGWMGSEGEDRIQKQYHQAEDNWLAAAGARLPNGRLLEPQEVARAVAFLASDESGMMTGSVVHFDQSVFGAFDGAPSTPAAPMTLP